MLVLTAKPYINRNIIPFHKLFEFRAELNKATAFDEFQVSLTKFEAFASAVYGGKGMVCRTCPGAWSERT